MKIELVIAEEIEVKNSSLFHIVCTSAEYPIEIEFTDHTLTLIELDGFPVNSVTARKLFLQPGETASVEINKASDNK